MIAFRAVLLVAAVFCFLLAAIDVQARVKPGWAGLMFWVLAVLLG
jgi:hypothetical protein